MKKILSVVILTAFILTSVVGCTNGAGSKTDATNKPAATSALKGSVAVSGSTALQPLVKEAADYLKKANPDLSITVNAGGSGTGLQNVADKTVDIGNSDVLAAEKLDATKAATLVDHPVCVVGIATVVNPDVKVTTVTKQQLVDIFTGKIKNWKEVGGDDMAIVLINRPASSGTRALFKKFALGGQDEATGQALSEDSSGTLKTTVEQTKGSIAYLAMSFTLSNSVKTLALDGVAPTYENIYSGKYPVWGYEHMYTNGEATGAAKALIDYIMSPEFAPNIEKMGYGVSSKIAKK